MQPYTTRPAAIAGKTFYSSAVGITNITSSRYDIARQAGEQEAQEGVRLIIEPWCRRYGVAPGSGILQQPEPEKTGDRRLCG